VTKTRKPYLLDTDPETARAAIARMPYGALIRCMDWIVHSERSGHEAPFWVWACLTQRLYEIGMFDNRVPAEHRKDALDRLVSVKAMVEARYQNQPDVLSSYRAANRVMAQAFKGTGVGSLAWQIKELGIASESELVQFISRPENAALLDDFLATLGSQKAERVRDALKRPVASSRLEPQVLPPLRAGVHRSSGIRQARASETDARDRPLAVFAIGGRFRTGRG
jgi:hypothetical protein